MCKGEKKKKIYLHVGISPFETIIIIEEIIYVFAIEEGQITAGSLCGNRKIYEMKVVLQLS